MLVRKDIIEEGDWVVGYETFNSMKIFQIKKGELFQNRSGNFKHDDMIGVKYGCSATALGKSGGRVLLLHPTPYLWTAALSVRTQILFQMDISMVLYHLDLRPGSVVMESGTGSGSLTTSMARAVAPHGHVHTFEFNADRVEKAKIDFKNNGLDGVVTCRHRDVCGQGFPFFPEGVDAVFLDLPTPWLVVDDCHRSLRPQGRFCSFSPCIEQLQRVCSRLNELKYEDIITVECLLKPYDVRMNRMTSLDLEALAEDFKSNYGGKKREGKSTTVVEVASDDVVGKRAKTDESVDTTIVQLDTTGTITPKVILPSEVPYLTKPVPIMRGHTGYLTFARKPCSAPKEEDVAQDEEEEVSVNVEVKTEDNANANADMVENEVQADVKIEVEDDTSMQ